MSDQESPIEVVAHPFAFRLLQVVRATRIAPQMVRVTLGGEQLEGFRSDAADDGTRLYFPYDVTDISWLPTVENAKVVFPEGQQPLPGREFTPRRHDPVAGELDFDFVVHGHGPASTWATNAAPGHYIGVSGPRRSRMVTGAVGGYVMAGDDTGLPSIARRLETLPAGTPALVIIEVANADHEQQLQTEADIELHWVYRDGADNVSDLLANALRERDFPTDNIFAWAAGEASSLRAVRRHFLQERGISSNRMRTTGYWKREIANYDHHLPLE